MRVCACVGGGGVWEMGPRGQLRNVSAVVPIRRGALCGHNTCRTSAWTLPRHTYLVLGEDLGAVDGVYGVHGDAHEGSHTRVQGVVEVVGKQLNGR